MQLWLALAALLATRRGTWRKASLRGLVALGGARLLTELKPVPPLRHSSLPAAFATAVALENPRLGAVVAPVAGTLAWYRLRTGELRPGGLLAGAALGIGVGLATQRWWPVRHSDEAIARPFEAAPRLAGGRGLVLIANQRSGDPSVDTADEIRRAFPDADVVRANHDERLGDQLNAAADAHPAAAAIGVSGGDGSVAAAATVAYRRNLPLAVVPTGTLNHFARDVGVYDLQEAVDAVGAGQAVHVDIGLIDVLGSAGEVRRSHHFVNTSSLGSYPELVRLREKWQSRWTKWPAFAAALSVVLHRSEPVRMRIDGEPASVWFLFVGANPYLPDGMVPAWRPALDTGLLDVRWLRADLWFSRTRAVVGLVTGALGHSRVYVARRVRSFDVELAVPGMLATDGEVVEEAGRYTFRMAPEPISVYRRHEDRWTGRERPFQR